MTLQFPEIDRRCWCQCFHSLQAELCARTPGKAEATGRRKHNTYYANSLNEFWLKYSRTPIVKIKLSRLKVLHFFLIVKFQALNMHWNNWVIACGLEVMGSFQHSNCTWVSASLGLCPAAPRPAAWSRITCRADVEGGFWPERPCLFTFKAPIS